MTRRTLRAIAYLRTIAPDVLMLFRIGKPFTAAWCLGMTPLGVAMEWTR